MARIDRIVSPPVHGAGRGHFRGWHRGSRWRWLGGASVCRDPTGARPCEGGRQRHRPARHVSRATQARPRRNGAGATHLARGENRNGHRRWRRAGDRPDAGILAYAGGECGVEQRGVPIALHADERPVGPARRVAEGGPDRRGAGRALLAQRHGVARRPVPHTRRHAAGIGRRHVLRRPRWRSPCPPATRPHSISSRSRGSARCS
jgi:hypothetical protein